MKKMKRRILRTAGLIGIGLASVVGNYGHKTPRLERVSDEERILTAYVLMHEGVSIFKQNNFNPEVVKYVQEYFDLADKSFSDVERKDSELYEIVNTYRSVGLELLSRKRNPVGENKILRDVQEQDLENYVHRAISRY